VSQDEFDLGVDLTPVHHRRLEGERGKAQAKEPDPNKATWRRVHTTEKCQRCIDEIRNGGKPRAPWPASYVRTEGDQRLALCYQHSAPLRAAEGLRPQRN